ncbi:MAG: hypothetical protein U0R44_07310 [Candidatus Micrarchaeia archaeon]
MRREIFAILLLCLASSAALDQSYYQVVAKNGSSQIEKTMGVAIFANQLNPDALGRMEAVCKNQTHFRCSVDVAGKKVTIREGFESGGYYSYETEYGLPYTTHTLTVTKIPTDKFTNDLERILVEAGALDQSSGGGGSVQPIDLKDEQENRQNAELLKQFKANITYTIEMPQAISESQCGNITGSVDGAVVRFDLIDVLRQSRPITVRGRELNLGYITAIVGLIVIIGLAVSFFTSKPVKTRR